MAQTRALQVVFETPEAFAREHAENLGNGGVFVAGESDAGLREVVEVEIALAFCDEKVRLVGEVVHVVPPELASTGAQPGVAVQFHGAAREVRRRLDPLVQEAGAASQNTPPDSGRRAAPRSTARVPARIDASQAVVDGRTRNLSQSGVLVAVPGQGLAIGNRVRVTLENPTTGEAMEVGGTVAREVETGGDVAAVGIAFDPPTERASEVDQFVEEVQRGEHARRLGGISGSIEALGFQNLVQMFGSSSASGTLLLRRAEDEGLLGFEGGLLRYVKLGAATGMKALVRLLSWTEGSFEFHAQLEPHEANEAPLPLEAALFDAVRRLEEGKRLDATRFPPEARVVVSAEAGERVAGEPHTKVEEAVLDLARAGFTVQRIIDVIPEPDPDILCAFDSLRDGGEIQFER